MLTFTTPQLQAKLKDDVPSADPGVIDNIDFLEFQNLEGSVKEDVKFLQEHPLVLPETKITGWVYEVETGKVSYRFSISFLGCHAVDDAIR